MLREGSACGGAILGTSSVCGGVMLGKGLCLGKGSAVGSNLM